MNSAPVLDSSAAASVAAAPELLAFPGPAPTEEETQAFGNVLAQATAQTVEEPEPEPETEVADPLALLPVEGEQEEEKPEPILTAPPLVFFCPPPELKPLLTLEAETTVETPIIEGDPELAVCDSPLPTDLKTDSGNVIETVRPKHEKVLAEAKDAKPVKAITEITKSEKLALEGFEPVSQKELEIPHPQLVKAAELPPQAVAGPLRGTVVAQQANAMNNGQKSAEIAPTIEQKMPVGERSRRVLPEQARFETANFIADTFARAKGEFSVEAPAREISTRMIDAAQLVETIRTEVTQLRQRGDATMTVALRPDNGTELKLEMSVSRDGTIHANVRCERGDFQTLNAQWPQLQQALAAQGIRVNDLSNPGNSQNHHHNDSHAQNFERGNNSQHRQQQPDANFEEELAASTPRYPANNNLKTAAGTTRRWQSWA